jgi:hypothetical protein
MGSNNRSRRQFGQQCFGEEQGDTTELAVDGALLGGELLLFQGVLDGLASTAVVACEGIGDDADEFGEGELLFVAVSAVALVEGLEDVVDGEIMPQGVESVRQGQTGQDVESERGLGRFRLRRQDH